MQFKKRVLNGFRMSTVCSFLGVTKVLVCHCERSLSLSLSKNSRVVLSCCHVVARVF